MFLSVSNFLSFFLSSLGEARTAGDVGTRHLVPCCHVMRLCSSISVVNGSVCNC